MPQKKRKSFVNVLMSIHAREPMTPAEIVTCTRGYFKKRFDQDIKEGRVRKCSFLGTTQSTLSAIKRCMQEKNADAEFCKCIRLSREDMAALNKEKASKVHDAGVEVATVAAAPVIRDSRALLVDPDASIYIKAMALACLTGRRVCEILVTAVFHPPEREHPGQHEQFWSRVTGIAKQRGDPSAIEVPLLERRDEVVKSVQEVQGQFRRYLEDAGVPPEDYKRVISRKFGKQLSRTVQRYCPVVGKMHTFRRFYALVCCAHFKEANASDVRVASDVLGHKQVSVTVLTYLNFALTDLSGLSFAKPLADLAPAGRCMTLGCAAGRAEGEPQCKPCLRAYRQTLAPCRARNATLRDEVSRLAGEVAAYARVHGPPPPPGP